jgi:transketolase
MRGAFANTLTELADRDPRVMLLTGDLGYMALEPFAERHPDRFVNVGVAEQNMVGIATGLAEAGFVPFVYSIVTFATLRPFEFVRNGPVLHQLPVRVVGIGGGFEYGHAGPTHHGTEDVGVMRTLPGMTVIAPADHRQARAAIEETWDLPGPIYYRLGKDDKTVVTGLNGRFTLGRAEMIRDGGDMLLVAMGAVATEAVTAANHLAARGVEAGVMIVASISPPPVEDLAAAAGGVPLVVTVEAHSVAGGVGSLVAETIADRGIGCRLVRCGVRSAPDGRSGSTDYYHRVHGLNGAAVAESAVRALQGLPPGGRAIHRRAG